MVPCLDPRSATEICVTKEFIRTGITTPSEGWDQRIVVVSMNSPIDEAQ